MGAPTISAEGRIADTHGVSPEEVNEIAVDAYVYAYPMVMMEVSRRTFTNVVAPDGRGKAPINQILNKPTFPDHTFREVVRANVDTLYSTMWYDVSREPVLVSVPDPQGRYVLFPILDYWTDVFASPGTRTTGPGPFTFAIVGPTWEGKLPAGVTPYRSPTPLGWMIGRSQTNGVADYDAVHEFQAGVKAVPLSQWGKTYAPTKGQVNPAWHFDNPPPFSVGKLDAQAFLDIFAETAAQNQPHAVDFPLLDRLRRVGFEPSTRFVIANTSPGVQKIWLDAWPAARQKIYRHPQKMGISRNGWRVNLTAIGTYGVDYTLRAAIAFGGLGANSPDDAVYPSSFTDADGKPYTSDERYVLHFENRELPPSRAFWSLTMYDEQQYLAENPINRFALGDRDKLTYNPDGSLDIYIERESPGKARESNWLPTPRHGPFSMNVRVYWPRAEALDGSWMPPPVQRVP